jgi:hypothetical protein
VFSAAAAMAAVIVLMGMTAPQLATKPLLAEQPLTAAMPPTAGQRLMSMPLVDAKYLWLMLSCLLMLTVR